MSGGAAFRQGTDLAERQLWIGKRQKRQGGLLRLVEAIEAGRQRHRNPGEPQGLQIAIEAAHVDAQPAGQGFTLLGGAE